MGKTDRKRGKESILESSSPMTASVSFPNRAIIVECLVVTVLVEDAEGGMCGVCLRRRKNWLVLETKDSIAFVVKPIYFWSHIPT